ncbi:MAG TPA: di-heme oxidoredictase family protein [Candidatus Binatus sp.]|nr:di-heme oxidoredictase family protein [Candidatus Binatus sp.]
MPRAAIRLLVPIALTLSRSAAGEFGDPLPGLTPDELQRFSDGRTAFDKVEGVADGLGPVFNGTSCGGCHSVGGTGGGSETTETRFGAVTNGGFDPLTAVGGSLIQTDGIGAQGACTFVGDVVPPQATVVARRRTTPLFGLGLVNAVPDATLLALAADEARRHPETAGRPNMVTDITTGQVAVGRFGWKSQVPNLLQFAGDAYLNEMGITTPMFPDENCPQGDCSLLACDPVPGVDDDLGDVERFRDFMSFLAPPPRAFLPLLGPSHHARLSAIRHEGGRYEGGRLFDRIGCASCHVRSLRSGPSGVAALQLRAFQPYSDFLLHDMGRLGDGIEQGQATGPEMRTAPLWGLRLSTTLLHDGRARTIEDAILAHDGQARGARDRFRALPGRAAEELVAFLRRL